MEPLVSVIIPVYNVAPFLRESLDSVCGQSYQNLEIIVVDDGSDDGSGGICDGFAARDRRIKVIHQDNRGLGGARNTGLDLMKGDLVAFLDSDDVYFPETIQTMVELMTHEGADIVICGFDTGRNISRLDVERTAKFGASFHRTDSREALNGLIRGDISFAVWNKLYARKLWTEERFPEQCDYEDGITILRVVEKAGLIVLLDRALIWHRKRPGSITMSYSYRSLQDWQKAHEQLTQAVHERMPGIIDDESCSRLMESCYRSYAAYSAGLLIREPRQTRGMWPQLRVMALDWWAKVDAHSCLLNTRVIHWLFLVCPRLIPVVRKAYRAGKRALIKTDGEMDH